MSCLQEFPDFPQLEEYTHCICEVVFNKRNCIAHLLWDLIRCKGLVKVTFTYLKGPNFVQCKICEVLLYHTTKATFRMHDHAPRVECCMKTVIL